MTGQVVYVAGRLLLGICGPLGLGGIAWLLLLYGAQRDDWR